MVPVGGGPEGKRMPQIQELAEQIPALEADVLAPDGRVGAAEMLARDLRRRHEAANRADAAAWAEVASEEDWQRFAKPRRVALEASLGRYPAPPAALKSW